MWENMAETDRSKMTIRRTGNACWITKAINTHSDYVIFIAFPRQQWLRERASMWRLYAHCRLANSKFSRCHAYLNIRGSISNTFCNKYHVVLLGRRDSVCYMSGNHVKQQATMSQPSLQDGPQITPQNKLQYMPEVQCAKLRVSN